MKLDHKVQETESTIHMVPDLVQHTLLSTRNYAAADYILIYDGNEVNIHGGQTAKIRISESERLEV